jgi:hypothetical protein
LLPISVAWGMSVFSKGLYFHYVAPIFGCGHF